MPDTTGTTNQDTRCEFTTTNGRRCRNLHQEGTPFCPSHRSAGSDDPAFLNELFGGQDDAFHSAEGLHCYLRRLSRAVAEGRLDPRQANSLAYIGQLLVNSLPMVLTEDGEEQQAERIEGSRRRLLAGYGLARAQQNR